MLLPDAAPLLYHEVEKIADHPSWSPSEQVVALGSLLERIFYEATRREQLMFSTLFARISYAGHLFHIQPEILRDIHLFRRVTTRVRAGQIPAAHELPLGLKALSESVLVLTHVAIPEILFSRWLSLPVHRHIQDAGELKYAAALRVTALRDDPQAQVLEAIEEEQPDFPIRIRYGLPERNENFMPTIQVIRKVFGFPVTLQLLDVEIDASGYYCPRVFVVEPDYLVDVSAISECFKDTGQEPYTYLARKFLPYETTEAILVGNIANHFLDRLLHEPEAEWQVLFRETFQLYPFVYAPMTDQAVREVSQKAQKHFLHLKQMASGGLAKQGIEPENCVLEPTFFSELYGIQGRLDLFYRTETRAAIVELKSGQPYKPNSYGISRSHFTQTLLYDLLVRSVFGNQTDPAKYILYSGVDLNHLRFAPTVAPEQWESLQLRNQLVAIERLLTAIQPGEAQVPILNRLRAVHGAGKGFVARDYTQFETVYTGLSLSERKYFNAFTGFIAREHWMAKVGEEGADNQNGLAALWRNGFRDKQAAFSILSHLEIAENKANQPDATLVFKKTQHTNPLANFRVGDIAVLYPALEETDTVLHHQVIKCTIVELGKTQVTVQLRYRQFNLKPFETEGLWHLEPDFMDISFGAMYRGLLEWAGADRGKRAVLMAVDPTPNPSPRGEGGLSRAKNLGAVGGVKDATWQEVSSDKESFFEGKEGQGGVEQEEGGAKKVRKIGSYGHPEETTPLDRWQYLKVFARSLRKSQTLAEQALWEQLRDRDFEGTKFRRQHAIDEYIVDFVSLEHRLVIEVDGTIHDFQETYDQLRSEYLGLFGFAVIRFKNEDVLNRMPKVLTQLKVALTNRKNELAQEIPIVTPRPTDSQLPNITTTQAPLPPGGGVGGGVGMTPEQHLLFQKIIRSQGYFLLWGPPGTGKTSVMLRALVDWVLRETQDNLLLLAYTNRAVDEICEALDALGGDIRERYLRIGSRHAAAEHSREQLLSVKIASLSTRAELRSILENRRVFVSTVASFGQNDHLLRIKKIQRLIVDEASQILEPQLIGLLTRFEHFTLIGDHRQLPAVTTQRPEMTLVQDADLNAIGLTDLRDSYFERLYRRCESENWHWAYGRLSHQGRMHADIMDFPNRHFYGGFLHTLTGDDEDAAHYQQAALGYETSGDLQAMEHLLKEKRVVFLPTQGEESMPGQKTNKNEADLVAQLVLFFKKLFAENGKSWSPSQSLGVITPWRAQIAQIRASLAAAGLDPDEITVDTVERYQGGAREVILLSTCVNSEHQLASLVNLSGENVDRKLNVALTRARQHVVVLGNAAILRKDQRYRAFIEQYS